MFGEGGADDLVGDGTVKAGGVGGGEGFFHAAVFAGVKGEDDDAGAGIKARGKGAEKGVERGELVVDCDAQGLKDTADGERGGVVGEARQSEADGGGELGGGAEGAAGEKGRERGGVRLVGIFGKERGEGGRKDFFEKGGGWLATGWVHSHIERAGVFHGKTTRRIVDLHGGDAEIGEDEIDAAEPDGGEDLGQAGEVTAVGGEGIRPEAKGAQAGFGFREFEGIGVEAQEVAAGLEAGEEFAGVAAIAERAIDGGCAGSGREEFQNLGDHDRAVRAGGGFARGDDFGDGGGVAGRIVFLKFIREVTRVFARVTRAATMRGRDGIGCGLRRERRNGPV